ncbi:AAA family ATPase [Thalassotalea sp. G2M2-11]|uniref:AAA family ATPase n=1 Tax=Thalassotalea sp. G2M2-11 TaxID=2787627 RepID=UPI0019D1BB04|nr:AAA family ATPase [Thalassotalea sp. G2M2-11]
MTAISLPLPGNVLHTEEQVLEFDKIATFIGGNGSGKSSILKSIFDEKLKPASTRYQDYKIVCFSSGQNESYSKDFGEHLNSERFKKNALNLDCFYYDKIWSKLLIFLASTTKPEGLVRSFLKQNNYVIESELDEDLSTKLSFQVKVGQQYVELVKGELVDEANGKVDVVTNKAYHQTLYNFIKTLIDNSYDFEEPLKQTSIELTQESLADISFERDTDAPFDSTIMFFTQAADNDYFIVKESCNLTFVKQIEGTQDKVLSLEELSDGEYQLLFLNALIDLFDTNNTIFLLDEADSHLHYENIDKLWTIFNDAQGRVISTTHLLDSISKAGVKRIRVVENGKVKPSEDPLNLVKRLETLSDIEAVLYKVVSMYKNVVIMDCVNDWEIFKLLVYRKLAVNEEKQKELTEFFSDFICVGIPSSFNGAQNDNFADTKINWCINFCRFLYKSKGSTQQAFMICDRDELALASIDTKNAARPFNVNGIKVSSTTPLKKCHLLSWWRREIKHYLLSFTALESNIDKINEQLAPACQLKEKENGDLGIKGAFNNNLATLPSELIKKTVDPFISKEDKLFCVDTCRSYVEKIPREEISSDIEKMYMYLVANNE